MTAALQPLSIVHLDTGRELRGGQHQLLLLARGLRERGHRQLVACREASALAAAARERQLPTFELPEHDPAGAHGIVQLRERLAAAPCDILHAHDGRGQTLAWLASAGLPLRRVAHRRVTFMPSARWGGRAIHRLKYRYTCDAVIAVSQFIQRRLTECGVPERMIEVIPDGIEIPPPSSGGEAVRRATREPWGFSPDAFVAGCLISPAPEKGLDVAAEAARRLAAQLPQARVVLALSRAALVAAPPNVRVVPTPIELDPFFAALDLYLVPSRAEGLGSSALLAMARGVPVVASNVGGLPEIVSAETGWLIPPGSPEALAGAIADAASDRPRLAQFGLRGRERASQFSAGNMVQRTEALYARLAAGRAVDSARVRQLG